jgi:hypothetical protein
MSAAAGSMLQSVILFVIGIALSSILVIDLLRRPSLAQRRMLQTVEAAASRRMKAT